MGPGREAASVRQVVLVIVLVGAAFLGGAFVNGPGLRWVQMQLLGSLGLNEEGEIASVDLKGAVGPGAAGEGSRTSKAGTESVTGPHASMPSLITEIESGKADGSESPPSRPGSSPRSPALSSPLSPPEPPPLSAPLTRLQSASGPAKATARAEARPVSASPDL